MSDRETRYSTRAALWRSKNSFPGIHSPRPHHSWIARPASSRNLRLSPFLCPSAFRCTRSGQFPFIIELSMPMGASQFPPSQSVANPVLVLPGDVSFCKQSPESAMLLMRPTSIFKFEYHYVYLGKKKAFPNWTKSSRNSSAAFNCDQLPSTFWIRQPTSDKGKSRKCSLPSFSQHFHRPRIGWPNCFWSAPSNCCPSRHS